MKDLFLQLERKKSLNSDQEQKVYKTPLESCKQHFQRKAGLMARQR
jgi:hypothetical protein